MTKNRKINTHRIFSLLLSLVFMLSLLPVTALAAETLTLGDFSVTVESGSAGRNGTHLHLEAGGNYTVRMAEGKDQAQMTIDISGSSTAQTSITVDGVSCRYLYNNSDSDVKLTLNGENVFSIEDTYSNAGSLTIGGSGSLTAQRGIHGEDITINGGSVTATGEENKPGIGIGGDSTDPCNITINGGIVNATGGAYAAGIGKGYADVSRNSTVTVTINNGTVTAIGGDTSSDQTAGAGIGGGEVAMTSTVTISGGTVIATGGNDNSGISATRTGVAIGGGFENKSISVTTVNISGGIITVSGGQGSIGDVLVGSSFNTANSAITITGGGFTKNPDVSGAYRISKQATGGSLKVKLGGYDIVAAGATETLNVIPTPNAGYELKGLYLLDAGDAAPTANHYIDTSVFRANALGSSYDFDMPAGNVTVCAVFEPKITVPTTYPILADVVNYDGARLYVYNSEFPYDGEYNDVGQISEAYPGYTVKVMLDASATEKSINKLPEDYELVGLYLNLNADALPDEHSISDAFTETKLEWGSPVNGVRPYGGPLYTFTMPAEPVHIIAVIKDQYDVSISTCDVIYAANGGSGEMPAGSAVQGAAFTLPECGFTPPEGHEFKAWSIDGQEYAPGDIVRFAENATVTAVWENIDAGAAVLTGETDVTMQKGVDYFGGYYVLTPPEGVTFTNIEWSVSGDFPAGISLGVNRAGGDGSSRAFLDGTPTAMTDAPVSVTINAEATDESKTYTGSLAVSITVEDSPTHMKLDELIQSADCEVPMETANTAEDVVAWVQNTWLPSLSGYSELVGQLGNDWTITVEDASTPDEGIGGFTAAVAGTEADPDGTDGSLTVRFRLDETYNYLDNSKECIIKATAYSVSLDTTTYTVTYNANGGSGEMESDTVTSGTAFALPECGFTPPESKTFKAWSIDGQEYAPRAIFYFEENTTVTAVWEDSADIDPVEILLYAMLIEGTSSEQLYEGELLDDYQMPTLTDFSQAVTLPGDYIDEYITVGGVVYEFKGIVQYSYDEATETYSAVLMDTYTIAAAPEYGTDDYDAWHTPISDGIYAAYMAHTHSYDNDSGTTCDCGHERELAPIIKPIGPPLTTYIIYASSGENGSVSTERRPVSVKEGGNVTFWFYPDMGYEVSAVWVDDLLVNNNGLNYDHYWDCDGCDECWWIDWSQWYDHNDSWYDHDWTDWQDGITFYDVDADHELYVEFAPIDSGCASEYYYDLNTEAWYHEAVDFVIEKDIMKGVTGKYFDPNGTTTRGQLVTMLYRLAGEPKVSGGSEFLDVADNMWYTDAVIWAVKKGIMEGYGNGYFGVNDIVTREQTVTILYRYAKYMGISVSKLADLKYFLDNEDVSDYAEEPFGWAVSRDIIVGKTVSGDSLELDPQGSTTRVETATMLMRFCEMEK